ncbi:hypothetical protein [Sphingomonas japonica]|uniref:Glucosyl transferase GtrII n=1 Tax=Sphingomonas japonica TaxID=511662 RepID=A0ABX0U0P2_9SPHN|nr:hypothetical protein [Sphingomonas japonica]NIJ24058.1 hypothetical protein [Sphingomonas japonica]
MQGDAHTALRWWQTRWFVGAMALAAAIPLLWPDIPPLVDLPGHMGRWRVQQAGGEVPWLAQWYDFNWMLIGNLGIDLLMVVLEPLLGLELAVKLVVLTIPPLTAFGLLWIAREVHGRVPPTALFALPLVYGYPLQFGFVNFALSMALALNAFALWLRLARLGRLQLRAALFVPLGAVIWVCHTFGWGMLGLLAFSAEAVRQYDKGQHHGGTRWFAAVFWAGIHCLSLAPPAALMVLWRTGGGVSGQTADWFNWRAKTLWLMMVLRDRWLTFDLAGFAALLIVIGAAIRSRTLTFSRNLAFSALVLAACYVLLPRIVFGSAYADMRLAPYMLAIGIVAIRPKPDIASGRAVLVATAGLAFVAIRLAATTVSFYQFDRVYDRELAALDAVPVGARLVSFIGHNCRNDWKMSRIEHLPAMALVRRLAFSNDQWSMAGAQLLTTKMPQAPGFRFDPSQITTPTRCPREWWRPIAVSLTWFPRDVFTHVWLVDPGPYDRRLEAGLKPLWRDGRSVVFEVEQGVPAATLRPNDLGPLGPEFLERIGKLRGHPHIAETAALKPS